MKIGPAENQIMLMELKTVSKRTKTPTFNGMIAHVTGTLLMFASFGFSEYFKIISYFFIINPPRIIPH